MLCWQAVAACEHAPCCLPDSLNASRHRVSAVICPAICPAALQYKGDEQDIMLGNGGCSWLVTAHICCFNGASLSQAMHQLHHAPRVPLQSCSAWAPLPC